jgi:hypothetical protein
MATASFIAEAAEAGLTSGGCSRLTEYLENLRSRSVARALL